MEPIYEGHGCVRAPFSATLVIAAPQSRHTAISDSAPPSLTTLQTIGLIVPIVAALVLLVFGVNNLPDLWQKLYAQQRKRKTKKTQTAPIVDTLPRVIELVDRVKEIEQIKKALTSEEPLVSVAGSTGVGKSAVAVSAVAAYRDSAEKTIDGSRKNTLWIDANDSCPTLEDLARILSLSFSQPGLSAAPSRDKEFVIRHFLAANPTILIIDNFASPSDPRQQLLMDLLESLPVGSCAVLSWGERALPKGRLVRVDDLDMEHARGLLLREAQRHGVLLCHKSDLTATVEEIYARLGGNPQGLRWLVLEIKNSARNVTTILKKLTLRDSRIYAELFGNIWETLDPNHQNVLIGVADARTPVSSEYLVAATGLKESALHDEIESLLLMGVLEKATDQLVPRVRLPNITKSYVISNADRRRMSSTRRRLARNYIRRLESDWEDAAGVEHDIENIIQVFLQATQEGDCKSALRLFSLMLDILFTLGLFDDRITLGHAAVECARQLQLPTDEALAWSVIASTHTVRAEYRQADEALIEGRRAADRSGSAQAIAYQARCRAYNYYREGLIEDAKAELMGTLELADSAGDVNGAIDIVALECALALYERRVSDARMHVDDFDERIRNAGWRRAEAYPYQEYAELDLWERNMSEATDWAEKARDIALEYRDRRQEIRIGLTLGRIAIYSGDLTRARTLLDKAAADAGQYGLINELAEIRAHIKLAARRPRWLWKIWFLRCEVPHRLTVLPVGGD